jgi:hypothetical protein
VGDSMVHANLGFDAFSIVLEKTEAKFQRRCLPFMLRCRDHQ